MSALIPCQVASSLACVPEDQAHTFSIIAEAHLGLTKTNCVFPGCDSIEFFELILGHALQLCEQKGVCDQ